jgi:predicted outer membrane repeat protein
MSAGGVVTVINSTFTGNSATRGGAVATVAGRLSVTNTTFAGNQAREGSSVFSAATLLLRNSILAGATGGGAECVNRGPLDPRSSHNLMATAVGCGEPLLTDDPQLGSLGYYNGPTQTLPLDAASPAVNVGSNAAAVDEHDRPLQWDQRGNGDPRDAAGITDLGAFEVQSPVALRVDRADDVDRRACSQLAGDCSLRGAWNLANAGRLGRVIEFDGGAHLDGAVVTLHDPLPPVDGELLINGASVVGLRLQLGNCDALPASVGIVGIVLLGPEGPCPQRPAAR